ncbi:hypothetical protein TrVE_jg12970 [Triparma verrucosa]|uniref:Uncharacterized protein n=2 Tax=Triparma TaxID=722752 RepID=A0A9W7B474_9STRA|nr:hypothetical protein TrST_g11769 [Triparma strigata]GMH82082.1 hypothetical protein TrVE_jg12970 [Triparma verrucosa]
MPPKKPSNKPVPRKKIRRKSAPPRSKLANNDLSLIASKITPKTSPIFHILDRRVNLDAVPADASLYDLARRWVWDDPFRVIPSVDITASTGKSRRDVDEGYEIDPEESVPKPQYTVKPVAEQVNLPSEQGGGTSSSHEMLRDHVARAVAVRRKDIKRIRRLNRIAEKRQRGRKHL